MSLDEEPTPLDAVLAELWTNACEAISRRGRVDSSLVEIRHVGPRHLLVVDRGPGMSREDLLNATAAASGMGRRELVGHARAHFEVSLKADTVDDVDAERWNRLTASLRAVDRDLWRPLRFDVPSADPVGLSGMRELGAVFCSAFRLPIGRASRTDPSRLLSSVLHRIVRLNLKAYAQQVLSLNLRVAVRLYSIVQQVRMAAQVAASLPDRPPGEVVMASCCVPRGPDAPREISILVPRGKRSVLA